jgi:hypothetical protein
VRPAHECDRLVTTHEKHFESVVSVAEQHDR